MGRTVSRRSIVAGKAHSKVEALLVQIRNDRRRDVIEGRIQFVVEALMEIRKLTHSGGLPLERFYEAADAIGNEVKLVRSGVRRAVTLVTTHEAAALKARPRPF